ncbi:MAG: response regulator [Planctomycetes bacterium]|nr:response regulator [Planctomycetota bacterium]
MSIRFQCPCGKRLSVPDGSEGHRVRCPVCRTVTRLPGEKRSDKADQEHEASEEVQPQEEPPPKTTAPRARILLADDDADVAAVVTALHGKGFDVVLAEDGEEAIELLQEEDRLDLVIVEVTLPKANGFEVCRAAKRRDPARPPMPVIMVTARQKQGDTDLSHSAKADAFLRKPFRPSDLCRRVEELLAPGAH